MIKYFYVFLLFITIDSHAQDYLMSLLNGEQIDGNTFQFEIYIQSNSGSFSMTNFQGALIFNNGIINGGTLTFIYINGSSQLTNPPVIFDDGIENESSHLELTFGSNVGNDNITTTNTRVGTFRLINTVAFGNFTPDIEWNFVGTFQTKLFNEVNNFTNIVSHSNLSYSEPLPVELISFTARIKGTSIELKWQTQSEINNIGFEVERKSSGLQMNIRKWEKIGFVEGNRNSHSTKDYAFTDKNPTDGTKFVYRLKQIDNDGTFTYSNEVEIELLPDKYELYQNFPNPFNPVTNIKFSLPVISSVKLDIYNIIGEHIVTLLNNDIEAGFYSIPFNASNLCSGTYIYKLQTDKVTLVKKMVLLK